MSIIGLTAMLDEACLRYSSDGPTHVQVGFGDDSAKYGEGYMVHFALRGNVLLVMASSPYRVPLTKRKYAASLLAAVNWSLSEGNFEMDVADGELRFRTSYVLNVSEDQRALCKAALTMCGSTYTPVVNTLYDILQESEELSREELSRRLAFVSTLAD